MAKYTRRIKTFGGQQATVPLKNKKDVENIQNYFLRKRELAKTKAKRYQADRNWMLCKLGFNTAFRAEDLLQLRVKDVENGYISMKELKTKKAQNYKMRKELKEEVLEYKKRNGLTSYDYMFTGQKSKTMAITRQQADTILSEAREGVKLGQRFSLHSMRKTYGYHFYKKTKNILTLQRMFNHDSPIVTTLYICWGSDDMDVARNEIYL